MSRLRLVLAAGIAVLQMAGCRSTENKPNNANVVLITVDTLRADHLACYGYRHIQTPAIDRLARKGVLFQQDIAQVPLTLPSHCSLLTGLLPAATGVRDQAGYTLPAGTPGIAGLLKVAGLQTAAFVASSVLNAETGLNRGFDLYSDVSSGPRGSPAGEGLEYRGDQVMTKALSWIALQGPKRFFAWIHLYDPHTPYAPPEPYRTQYAAAPYDGEIAFVDSLIARLTDTLATSALYDNTLIVLTSDHGEALGEHGESTHGFFLYDSTLRGAIDRQVSGLPLARSGDYPAGARDRHRTHDSGSTGCGGPAPNAGCEPNRRGSGNPPAYIATGFERNVLPLLSLRMEPAGLDPHQPE